MFLSFPGHEQPRLGVVWVPPVKGILKFNVDVAARGKLGLAGCGVLLRDWNNCILSLFSGPIGIAYSNEAKLQAICKALEMLMEFDWRGTRMVVVQYDSRVAVSWILQRERRL
ncbi:hypothetical protein GQ457_13G028820 [Hibiscus cannabinus]